MTPGFTHTTLLTTGGTPRTYVLKSTCEPDRMKRWTVLALQGKTDSWFQKNNTDFSQLNCRV